MIQKFCQEFAIKKERNKSSLLRSRIIGHKIAKFFHNIGGAEEPLLPVAQVEGRTQLQHISTFIEGISES